MDPLLSSTEDRTDASPSILFNNGSTEVLKSASTSGNFVLKEEKPYETFTVRTATFKDWPLHHFINPSHLVKAGFYYTRFSDIVQCYECGVRLRNFELDDIPMLEHSRWSPKCPLVRKFFKQHC